MRVLLMGGGDLAEEVCEALDAGGAEVDWLRDADDDAVRSALADERPDVVCVAAREDAFPLRMALLVRHLDADVPLVVTIFDPAMARQVGGDDPALPRDLGRRHRGARRSPVRVSILTSSRCAAPATGSSGSTPR